MDRIFKSVRASVVVLGNLVRDGIEFLKACVSSRTSLAAENLFLRKQLSFYQEHQIRPRRLTNSARVALVFWSRFFDWRPSLLIVKPATLIGWHRKAFRLLWTWKSRPGRPRLPKDLRQLIAEMVRDNPTWGQEYHRRTLVEARPPSLATNGAGLLAGRRSIDAVATTITELEHLPAKPRRGYLGL